MSDARIRDQLATIMTRPRGEWRALVDREFGQDRALRLQALLWLHSATEAPGDESAPPSLGTSADERYELLLRIDAGASASVWKAYDRRLGRHVAIKVFSELGDSDAVEQVLAEARAASDVVSEHVVRVLDVQYGDGIPYIVMELVSEFDVDRGETVLGASASTTRASSADEVARWVSQVARGVHEAHLRSVFHRDLKPKNVLITPKSRRARVADFGLSVSGASIEATHATMSLIMSGPSGPLSVRGTPEFMAPEQARGLPLTLDARSAKDRSVLVAIDVWGLGAIAYDLLSGHAPWLPRETDGLCAWEVAAAADHPSTLERMRDGTRIPLRLRRVIQKAMHPDPQRRYTSAATVAHDLEAYLARRPTTLDTSKFLRFGLWARRNPQLSLAAVFAIALTGFAGAAHLTVARLRGERETLDQRVAAQKAEQANLDQAMHETRQELVDMRATLSLDRRDLANLEKSVADERTSYQAVLDAKEDSLRSANATTKNIIERLETARQERLAAEQARAELARRIEQVRIAAEKASEDRERIRREREAARQERDAAIAEREQAENELRALKTQLDKSDADAAVTDREAP